MIVENGKKTIHKVYTPNREEAWRIEDIPIVLEQLHYNGDIILGGDVLTLGMEYNYDSWFYNIDYCISRNSNSQNSYEIAQAYIDAYINKNGKDYYVTIIKKGNHI